MLVDNKGEYVAIREMRKHCAWYLKGVRNSAKIRNEINKALNVDEIEELLSTIVLLEH